HLEQGNCPPDVNAASAVLVYHYCNCSGSQTVAADKSLDVWYPCNWDYVKSKLFLVFNRKGGNASEEMMSVKRLVDELGLPKNRVKVKDQSSNMTEFSQKLCEVIKASLLDVKDTMSIVGMVGKAVELGLSVDESKTEAQRKAAEEIMGDIGVRSIPHL
ncbi:unnamed protein product, partial [Pleuronectes platessa]